MISTEFPVYCINNKVRFVRPFSALSIGYKGLIPYIVQDTFFYPEHVGSTDSAGVADIIHLFLYTRSWQQKPFLPFLPSLLFMKIHLT